MVQTLALRKQNYVLMLQKIWKEIRLHVHHDCLLCFRTDNLI